MENIIFGLVIFAVFIAGYVTGMIITIVHEKPNGTIVLEKNEQGDDRIRFCLDMEYDDISQYSKIVFAVKKNM